MNLTQEAMADLCGISISNYVRIESGPARLISKSLEQMTGFKWLTEACILDESGRFVSCTLVVFCLDQHHETVLKNDFLMLPRFLQVLPAFSHAGQVKTFEVLEDLIFHVC